MGITLDRRMQRLLVVMVALGGALILTTQKAQAGGVVTVCDSDGYSFLAALQGGGDVIFDCGGPATIPTYGPVIALPTRIYGKGLVALTGVIIVAPGASLELDGLTLADGDHGIINNGVVTMTHSRVVNNGWYRCPPKGGCTSSGPVILNYGTFIIRDSLVRNISHSLYNHGTAIIERSSFDCLVNYGDMFIANSVAWVFNSGGVMTIVNSMLFWGSDPGATTMTNTLIIDGNPLSRISGNNLAGSAEELGLGPLSTTSDGVEYYPLLPGSPAIDAGTGDGCPETDVRGFARPYGAACDIGPVEWTDFPNKWYIPLTQW